MMTDQSAFKILGNMSSWYKRKSAKNLVQFVFLFLRKSIRKTK